MIPRPDCNTESTHIQASEDRRRAWWRWHFAGQIAALMSRWDPIVIAQASVQTADLLIAELEKEIEK